MTDPYLKLAQDLVDEVGIDNAVAYLETVAQRKANNNQVRHRTSAGALFWNAAAQELKQLQRSLTALSRGHPYVPTDSS